MSPNHLPTSPSSDRISDRSVLGKDVLSAPLCPHRPNCGVCPQVADVTSVWCFYLSVWTNDSPQFTTRSMLTLSFCELSGPALLLSCKILETCWALWPKGDIDPAFFNSNWRKGLNKFEKRHLYSLYACHYTKRTGNDNPIIIPSVIILLI